MRLVFGCDEIVAKWVSQKLRVPIVPPYTAIGVTRDGENLCGGAVFNDWNGSNLEVTVYGHGCVTRGNFRAVCHYAFAQLKANRLTARTARVNKRLQRSLPKLGFRYEGICRNYYGPDKRHDAIVYGLLKEQGMKWINEEPDEVTICARRA